MKPIISVIAISAMFTVAACNNSAIKDKDAAIQAQQHTIDSMNVALAKKQVIDSMNELSVTRFSVPPSTTTIQVNPEPKVVYVNRTKKRSSSNRSPSTASNNNGSTQAPVYQEPAQKKKKGWSAKAKGAVIGAGVGGVTGALVNGRNRAAGAVIGTVLGAAAGTGAGAIIDKKKGR